ncbi:MAG TPA: hypothetical protein DD473_06180 [Planctomycetaceae bacterium]|nr:hypothetical protein [Planctomycetaceae bacterium]
MGSYHTEYTIDLNSLLIRAHFPVKNSRNHSFGIDDISQVGQAPACLPTIVEWSDWECNNHPPIKFSKTREDYGDPL